MSKNHRAGFTLLEVTLSLLISAIVIGGLWVAAADIFFTHSVDQLEKGVIQTAARIRNFYHDRTIAGDTYLTNANLIQMNLVSPEIIKGSDLGHNMNVAGTTGNIVISTPGNCSSYFTSALFDKRIFLGLNKGSRIGYIQHKNPLKENAMLCNNCGTISGGSSTSSGGGSTSSTSSSSSASGSSSTSGSSTSSSGGSSSGSSTSSSGSSSSGSSSGSTSSSSSGGPAPVTTSYVPQGSGFSILLNNLTATACQQLIPRLAGTREQIENSGIVAVLVNGSDELTTSNANVNKVKTYDLNTTGLATACQSASGGTAGVPVEICFGQF